MGPVGKGRLRPGPRWTHRRANVVRRKATHALIGRGSIQIAVWPGFALDRPTAWGRADHPVASRQAACTGAQAPLDDRRIRSRRPSGFVCTCVHQAFGAVAG